MEAAPEVEEHDHHVAIIREFQSCSGHFLTKLQCIRMPEHSANSSLSNSSISLESSSYSVEEQHKRQSPPINIREIQSCSGNILTTLQCIKMPIQDEELSSVHSVDDSLPESNFSGEKAHNNSESPDLVRNKDETGSNHTGYERAHTSAPVSRSDSNEGDGIENLGNAQIGTENRKQPTKESNSVVLDVLRLEDSDDDISSLEDISLEMDTSFRFDMSIEEQIGLPQLYPMGPLVFNACEVCFETKDIYLRVCCDKPVCDDCMNSFISIQVQEAVVKIQCPAINCDQFVHRDEIMARLSSDLKEKFYRFLVDANKDPHIKTCPKCNSVMTIGASLLKDSVVKKKGLRVQCTDCCLEWCFPCQSPWHEGIKCKKFREGDALFKKWTKDRTLGQPNARKCPRCNIFIQRSAGCDHMRCTKCETDFCYKCGERFYHVKFFGDHYSAYSIIGCKYRLYPNQPWRRKLIRGSIFGAKLLLVPLIAGLVIGAGAVFLACSLFILPVWGGLRIRRHLREKEQRKQRKQTRIYLETLHMRQHRGAAGDPYLENFERMQQARRNTQHIAAMRSGRVLMVDELDMRMSSSAAAGDTQSVSSMDRHSVSSSAATAGSDAVALRIYLSPTALDVHASLDAATSDSTPNHVPTTSHVRAKTDDDLPRLTKSYRFSNRTI